MPPAKKIKLKRLKIVPTIKVKIKDIETKETSIEYVPVTPRNNKRKQHLHLHSQSDMIETPFCANAEPVSTLKNRPYSAKKQQEVQNWESLRVRFIKAHIQNQAPSSHPPQCSRCGDQDSEGVLRCLDCSVKDVWCHNCIMEIHPVQRLHKIEVFQQGGFFPAEMIEMKTVKCSSNSHLRVDMTLIDPKGRTHTDCPVFYEENLPVDLVSQGFWPVSPTSPTTAVSIELLTLMQCLTLECQVSVQGFINAIDANSEGRLLGKSKLCRITRGECVPEFRLFARQVKDAPVSLLYDNKWCTECPACPKEEGPLFISMDANFGLVHKKNAGATYGTTPIDSLFFTSQEETNEFVDSYFPDAKEPSEDCSNFQAVDSIRTKNKAVCLDVKGVFGSACRHEIPISFCDLLYGERLAYPVHIIRLLHEAKPSCVRVRVGVNVRIWCQSDGGVHCHY